MTELASADGDIELFIDEPVAPVGNTAAGDDDIELFIDEPASSGAIEAAGDDDVDLFIDDDFFDFSDDAEEDDPLGGLTPEQIMAAAEEFKNLFAGDGIEISSTTAAMSLFQSLQSIGFKCGIDMTDTSVTVEAATIRPDQGEMLLETVEEVMANLHHVAGQNFGKTCFVLRNVTLRVEGLHSKAIITIVSAN